MKRLINLEKKNSAAYAKYVAIAGLGLSLFLTNPIGTSAQTLPKEKSSSETYNYELLPGMDPYTTPNIFNQGGTAWENASREEKLQMLDEANMQDSSWTWEYEDSKFDCDGFSRVKLVNMAGCENFENWNYYYIFKNAIENNNVKITNGRFNIPVYLVSTDIDPDKDPSATSRHAINGTWVGPNNYVETRTASKFDQWVFFEPQRKGENGTYYVQPGDWQMDDNGSVRIYWFGNAPDYYSEEWFPKDIPILQYELENGIARPDSGFAGTGINPSFIIEDPNQIYTNYSSHPEVVVREVGTPLPSLSTEYYTTNTEYYRDRITEDREFSDSLNVNSISSAYDYEFDYQEKDSLYLKLGRHTIGDSKNYTVHVRDIQSPVFTEIDEFGYVPEVTIGYWAEGGLGGNVTPENPNIGLPAVIDSAGFPFDLNWQVELLEEIETSQKFRIDYTATDHALSKNQSVASQIVTVDLTTSIKETAENETAFWVYPNPAKEKLYVSFPSGVITNEMVFEIVNFSGQRIQIPTQCCISPIEIDLSGISKGVYFFRVANGNKYMQHVFIKE